MKYFTILLMMLVLTASCGGDDGKKEQTISFDPLTPHNLSEASFALNATASSGLTVAFASSNPSIAAINGKTVTFLRKGSVEITATQAGNDEYFEAPGVKRTLVINEDNNPDKKTQEITFNLSVNEWTFDSGVLTLEATSSSGLPVTFSSEFRYVNINGSSLQLTYEGVHYDDYAIVTASQAGNDEYNAAPNVSRTLHVTHSE